MKRLFPILVICLVIVGCFSFHITAKADDSDWSETAVRATEFSSRDDTSKKIEIASAAELGLLAYEVNAGNRFEGYTITLTADIDLSGHNWDPIGHHTESYINSSVLAFRGCFDGNGHTISNMKIQISSVDDNNRAFGLFGGVANGCVKNLNMTNAIIEIGDSEKDICAGTVAGFFAGSEVANITVNSSTITASGKNYVCVGGVSGCVYNSGTWDESSLSNIYASNITLSAVTSSAKFRGGVTGFANESYAAYNNCYVKDIAFTETAAQNETDASGGLIGYGNLPKLNYCYYDGETAVGVDGPYPPQISNTSREIAGMLETPVTINNIVYNSLVGALNAWVDNNGGSSIFQTWDCDDFGLEHDLEVVYLDSTYHELKCKNCKYSVDEKHKVVLQNEKDVSCTADGYSGDEVCSICNEIVEKGEVIEKLGHQYVDGKCTVCGTVDPDYKEPEVTGTSIDKNVNAVDEESKNNTSIPQTGDETPIALWIGIMTVACVAVAGICIYRKKSRYK